MATPPVYNSNQMDLPTGGSPPMAKDVATLGGPSQPPAAVIPNAIDPTVIPTAISQPPVENLSHAYNPLTTTGSDFENPPLLPSASNQSSTALIDNEYEDEELTLGDYLRATPSWLISMVFHLVLFIALGAYTYIDPADKPEPRSGNDITLQEPEEEDELNLDSLDDLQDLSFNEEEHAAIQPETENIDTIAVESMFDEEPAPNLAPILESLNDNLLADYNAAQEIGNSKGTGFSGRGRSSKLAYVLREGGSAGSELSVQLALRWLAAHQNKKTGGWNFSHHNKKCTAECDHDGSYSSSRNAATAIALLPFLGAGETHKHGKYKKTVSDGLNYLIRSMKRSSKKNNRRVGSLYEVQGQMYSHGLATIVLCEAYAMTNDYRMKKPAQLAVNYIVQSQDPRGGGWRYQPGQRGDTSVVGWQLMALKSGTMSSLNIPKTTLYKTSKFLDSVASNKGAEYGYRSGSNGKPTTSAIGLLCRMYLGWKHDRVALVRGVKNLSAVGPSRTDLYYNYYATQVMRHYGGEPWKQWNAVMRDSLVKTQVKTGHAAGSWYTGGDYGSGSGGRLYCTAMSCMILEVYYRHLPIYRKQSVAEGAIDDKE